MIYKQHKNGSYNIHTIKTDRFKSVRMEIVFRNNIDPNSIARRTALFEVLLENSEHYPRKLDLSLKQESLYNAYCYAVSSKVGNMALTSICLDFLNPKYTKDDYLEVAIALPFDLINYPKVCNNEFDEETLTTIKTRLEADIKNIKEDPKRYAINNALKQMDKNSVSGVDLLGTLKDLESITPANLYATYEDVMNHDYVDIFIIGDIDMDKAIDYINKYAQFKTIKNHEVMLEVHNKRRKKPLVVNEEAKFSQSQVVFILNPGSLSADERRYNFIIYNMILGGGSLETKLYQNLRDKNSLCYSVQSIYQKSDNLVLIHTSVDKKNVKKAIKLIKETIEEMAKGNISEEEVMRAKYSIITSINMSLDMPSRIIDQYLFSYISDLEDVETRIQKFSLLTAKDIIKVAKNVSINTIYTLESGEGHED